MKMKRILSVLSLATIIGTSSVAMAKTGCPDTGFWKYGVSKVSFYDNGKTKACWSKYVCWDYANYSATAKNRKGTKRVTKSDGSYAEAAVKAASSGNKAYYNYWD